MEKVNYLRDLADHPASTGADAAARLDVAQPAVLEAFRRAVRQRLVEGDGGRPQKFTLTEAGRGLLLQLENEKAEASGLNPGENSGQPTLPASADSEQRLGDLEAKMGVVFRLMANRLQDEGEAGSEGGAGRGKGSPRRVSDQVEDLLGTAEDNPNDRSGREEASRRRLVAELFEARKALGEMGWFNDKGPVKERIERLKEQLPPGVPQAVERLLELESEAEFWGPGAEVESEAAWLRERLGLPPNEDAGIEGAEEEDAEAESEDSEE